MQTIRPTIKGKFPKLGFAGKYRLCLGNGTAYDVNFWEYEESSNDSGDDGYYAKGIAIGKKSVSSAEWGYSFDPTVTAVKKFFELKHWSDARNLFDFIHQQFKEDLDCCKYQRRRGSYMAVCCEVQNER